MADDAQIYRNVIDKVMEAIPANDAFSSPTVLAGFIVRLAHANAMYGRYMAAKQAAYRSIRKDEYDKVIDKGGSATAAKETAKNKTIEQEKAYDEMYNVHQDTKDFITVCMSYLKIMGIEVRLNNL